MLRINSFIDPQLYEIQESDGSFTRLIYDILGTSALLQSIMAVIFIFFQAAFINRIVILNRLERDASLFPGVFYIIFASAISVFLTFSPLLIGTTFILFSITELFQTYKKTKSDHMIFSCGFWAGVAAIFYLPFLLYIIVIFVGLLLLKSIYIKDWFQAIAGLCVPFFLMGTILFWQDSLMELGLYFHNNASFFIEIKGFSSYEIVVFSVIGFIILFSVLNYRANTARKAIQVTKKIDILYWGILISLFAFLLRQPDILANVQILAFPVCVFLAFLFQKIENKFIAEIIHLVLITAIIVGHFQL